jgi:hypothetical protein
MSEEEVFECVKRTSLDVYDTLCISTEQNAVSHPWCHEAQQLKCRARGSSEFLEEVWRKMKRIVTQVSSVSLDNYDVRIHQVSEMCDDFF